MNLLKGLLGIIAVLLFAEAKAQEPEVYPLWPQGTKESNGLKGGLVSGDREIVAGNSVAELYVYRPRAGNNSGKVCVVCPGGGYVNLAMDHEGRMFAHWLNEQGITAVVLKYRMPNLHDKIPLADAQRSIRWVRSRADELGINPAQVGVAGFSAGGHLASTLATHFDLGKTNSTDRFERFSCRPDFVVLFYPVISMKNGLTHTGSRNALLGKNPSPELVEKYSNELHVTTKTPPVFLVHCDDDAVVSSLNSVAFYQALKRNKVPSVLYVFPHGGHGFGLNSSFEYYLVWTLLLENWLEQL